MTRSPPPVSGARASVPSCARVMVSTMARPRPTPAWWVRRRSVPRWNGSVSVETNSGERGTPVFSTASTTVPARTLVVTRTVPPSGRLWTMALCTRFVVSCSRSAGDPVVAAMSPRVSRVTPRSSARGRRPSAASSASSDRSTRSRVKERRSARLSRSSASVRSLARLLTAWRRSMISPVSWSGAAAGPAPAAAREHPEPDRKPRQPRRDLPAVVRPVRPAAAGRRVAAPLRHRGDRPAPAGRGLAEPLRRTAHRQVPPGR